MKKIYALFMTLCLVISATAAPVLGSAKKSYPLYPQEVVKAELALDASMQKAPAATQGLQYDATEGELIRYYNETDAMEVNTDYLANGNLYIDIMASDYTDYLSLLLFVEELEDGKIPVGTYPITSEPAYGTAYASQGYSATQGVIPCAYYPLVVQNGQLYISTPMYFMVSGSVTVEYVGEDLKLTINAVNSNNVSINIVYEVGGKSEKVDVKVPLKYDATEDDGALDYTFAEGATATATDRGFYGIYVVDAADASSELGLLFIYPEGTADAETTIPAGTYTINNSQAPGTVMASSGYSSQGLGYSFFINVDAEGYLELPMYFLVDGTVEVTNVDGYLKVEINATNSNDVPIHIVYDASPVYTTIEISNLVVTSYGAYDLLEGDDDFMGISVALGVDAEGNVLEDSEVTWNGMSLSIMSSTTITKSYSEELATDVYTGKVVVEFYGAPMGLDLTMYNSGAAPTETIDVIITDAKITIDEYETISVLAKWGDGELSIEGLDFEQSGFMMIYYETEDDYFVWMSYDATVTTEDNVLTITGEFEDNYIGTTYNVNISGQLPGTTTDVESVQAEATTAKMIENGQLVIENNGVQYNTTGAVIK